jgi:hypothetical protein
MEFDLTFETWSPSCQAGRQRCLELIAIHVFGHASGFGHEQDRPDSPEWCRDKHGTGVGGDMLLTPFDLKSLR